MTQESSSKGTLAYTPPNVEALLAMLPDDLRSKVEPAVREGDPRRLLAALKGCQAQLNTLVVKLEEKTGEKRDSDSGANSGPGRVEGDSG